MATNLVLLSGGVDSATALALAARGDTPCRALFLRYGQAAEREEQRAAAAIADHYSLPLETLEVAGCRFGPGEIRGRNAFLIHSGLLVSLPEPSTIIIGVHDGTGYVDCSPAFVELMQRSLALHTAGEVTLSAPFIDRSKGDIYMLALELGVPIELTYSCERGGDPCGKCLSCQDREALRALA